jgi:hypothetical protein
MSAAQWVQQNSITGSNKYVVTRPYRFIEHHTKHQSLLVEPT